MIIFKTALLKFAQQGEKTGWTYVLVPAKIASKLSHGNRKSFRIKGSIDSHPLKGVALIPMGGGDFIMPVNSTIRKSIGKRKSDIVTLSFEVDITKPTLSEDLLACLADDPGAADYFHKLPGYHQQYYSKWIESAKTEVTRTKRIALVVTAFTNKMSYAEMMNLNKRRD